MSKQFPGLDLEDKDKVNLNGGSNVTYETLRPPIMYHYRRKSPVQQKGEESRVTEP